MVPPHEELIILFGDIAQSTRLYDVLGDETAQELIGLCLTRLSESAIQNGGKVIKTIGDEVMCTFPEVEEAVSAAKAMHNAMDKRFFINEGPGVSLELRVGIHGGPVIQKDGDVFGDAVNVAARLVSVSKARQILLSSEAADALDDRHKKSIRNLGCIPLRGKTDDLRVCELVWEDYDMTIIANQPQFDHVATAPMEIRLGSVVLEVGPSRPSLTIGRDKSNDLHVPGNHVSRSHARIDFLGGKFLLSDQSSNGTYVSFRKGKSVHLKRDKVVLYGSGTISPGLKRDYGSRDVIVFHEIP